ncbi:MAG TPA: NYN domain-containing protein [Candidatus Limnocylindrales bacterium]
MSKNVAVFVDVANIFYAAKAAGADIDYVTLLKAAVAGRDFVRAYAYTGLDPENENQRNFHSFLARHGYKVVSKDIRKYGDGKVKANLDIELVVDMMKTARNLDVAIVVSGDGDFAPAIRAVQEMGVRVEVISFRGNTSSDLIEVADAFYDITQLARVDRDSSRSGRRVAGDDEDLSMTEVPDKQTEGRGGRGRGRGRGRGGRGEAAEEVTAGDTRGSRPSARGVATGTEAGSGGRLVALPGEKLSRATGVAAGEPADEKTPDEAVVELVEGAEVEVAEDAEGAAGAEATGHRRRRRGGRGRGHGRSQGLGEVGESDAVESDEGESAVPPAARPNQFGSVWDSQIGMAGRPERLAPISPDEDDYAEPEIPEYLLAERRRSSGRGGGGRGQGGGGRGVRSAYASAVERERFGRSSTPRYSEPVVRQAQPQRRRDERPQRGPGPQQHRGGGVPRGGGRDSAEPWSEVPPELEELLRAQLATKLSKPAAGEAGPNRGADGVQAAQAAEVAVPKASTRRGGRRKPAEAGEAERSAESTGEGESPAEKPRPAARGRRKPADGGAAGASGLAPARPEAGEAAAEMATPKKRAPARRKPAAAAIAPAESIGDGGEGAGE